MLARRRSRWWLGLGLFALTGCFGKLRRDERVRAHTGNLQGTVAVQDWGGSPIIVAAGRLPEQQGHTLQIVRKQTLREPAAFGFVLEPGSYLFGAIEDANRNEKLDDGERAFVTGAIDIADGEREVVQLTVREVFDREAFRAKHSVIDASLLATGDVLALDDARFGPEHASMGMWEPTKYALAHHPGVYMLAAYDPGKVPVLFVHGMTGYPREFESLIAGLDNDRFQPWVFMYPSGYPLATLAAALDDIVDGLVAQHGVTRMCVVAHSMGGLVARRFLGEHVKRKTHVIRGFVTLDSPLHGMASAAAGTKFAPSVVPSWYDLDPQRPFLTGLYADPLPDDIEYHLLFGFDDGGGSDGVVQLGSQLRVEAQAEAEVVLGYRATHTGILKSKAAAAQVYTAVRRCAGDETAPRVAPRPPEPKVVEDKR